MNQCPECGSTKTIRTCSDYVCANCGLCLAPVITKKRFIPSTTDEEEKHALMPLLPMGTSIGNHQERDRRFNTLQRIDKYRNSLYFVRKRAYYRLLRVCDHLQIPAQIHQLAYQRFKQIHQQIDEQASVTLAICLFIEVRIHQLPITVPQMLHAFNIDGAHLTNKRVNRCIIENPKLRQALQPSTVDTYLPKAMYQAIDYLEQRLNDNGTDAIFLHTQLQPAIQEVLERVTPRSGRSPVTVATTAVYAACLLLKQRQRLPRHVPFAVFDEEHYVAEYSVRDCWVKDFKPIIQEDPS